VRTIHIHLDESGNLDFSPTGSRYYIFAVAWTYEPVPLAADLSALRFSLIKQGHNINHGGFHAVYDPQPRRDLVLTAMANRLDWNFAAIVIDKPRVNPVLYPPKDFYPKFASMVLRFVFRGRVKAGTTSALIYTDTLPFPKKQAHAVEVTIKSSCRSSLHVPFHVCHHCSESNAWLQATDYCSWVVCRKWEHGDSQPYNRLRPRLAAVELAVMAGGDGTVYYDVAAAL
jgi:hypothetical protein